MRHFIGHQSASTCARQMIRSLRLHRQDLTHITRRELLNGVSSFIRFHFRQLKRGDWLRFAQVLRELEETYDVPMRTGDTEKRRRISRADYNAEFLGLRRVFQPFANAAYCGILQESN